MHKITLLTICLLLSIVGFSQSHKVYPHYNGQELSTKKMTVSFAEKETAYDHHGNIIKQKENDKHSTGGPDYKTNVQNTCSTLKPGAHLVLEFGAPGILDTKGLDIYIFNVKEMTQVEIFVSNDLNSWIMVGVVSDAKPFLDIKGKVQKGARFRYLKIMHPDNFRNQDTNLYLDAVAVLRKKTNTLGKPVPIENDTLYLAQDKAYLKVKDDRKWDGDRVTLYLNGKRVLKNKFLNKFGRKIVLNLKEGSNILKIKALNEGLFKPNTVLLEVSDTQSNFYKTFRIKRKRTKSLVLIYE